ncbi:MAG: hypothetical protein AAFQ12_04650 [Pseudomonadota bacterium]
MTNTVTQPIFNTAPQAVAPIITDSYPRTIPARAETAQNDNGIQVSESVLVRRRRRARSRLAH